MFDRYRKSGFEKPDLSLDTFPSAARNAQGASFMASVDALRRGGRIQAGDPRLQLDPVEVRKLSTLSPAELAERYKRAVQMGMSTAPDARVRARYAAVMKAGSQHMDSLDLNRDAPNAAKMEFMAGRLAGADPRNPAIRELFTITAAASDRAQRDQVMQGFEKGNIAKAAKTQGKSWIEMRDQLDQHGLLKENDPRRKIRPADIDNQKGGRVLRANTLPPEDLEDVAMRRLRKDPKDELAKGWLSAAGALSDERAPRKIKGAELDNVLPAKPRLFGTRSAARRKAAGIELS